MAGAPKGNQNSSKTNRLWGETIRKAALQADAKLLRQIADKLLEKAAEGDIQAIKELGDRLDGRSVQAVEAKVEGNISLNVSQGDASVL